MKVSKVVWGAVGGLFCLLMVATPKKKEEAPIRPAVTVDLRARPSARPTPPTAEVTPYAGRRREDPQPSGPAVGQWIQLANAAVVRYLDGGGQELARITAQAGSEYEVLEVSSDAIRVRDGWIALEGLRYSESRPTVEAVETPFPEQGFDPPEVRRTPRPRQTPPPRLTPEPVTIEPATQAPEPGMIWVQPYRKRNGTQVRGHWRKP